MVKLKPMTQKEFKLFLERDIRAYAEENVKACYWSEAEAIDKSRKEHVNLLPDGLASKDHHLFTIQDAEGRAVGVIWMKASLDSPRRSGFIFNLEIDEQYRGQGYATQAMLELEKVARAQGLEQLGLHVFAHNQIARGLYEKLGFMVSGLNMVKPLSAKIK
jgi:ribosomal protein S18 acetylase RimI-like enzyme